MKLIIQIPCFNEERTLPIVLGGLPRSVPGFDSVEYLVIDDGSDDRTVEVARENGVHHVVRHAGNKGLARAFMTGIDASLRLGADVIVNTDADNQYNADDIPSLVEPILSGRAEMVIGARPISSIQHFSFAKKLFQLIGSWAVRVVSGTDVPDAPSGFRAISRQAAHGIVVFNEYTYTIETIIQAGQQNLSLAFVPVRVNDDLRPSRLVKSTISYIKQSFMTICRVFVIYRPFRFFAGLGSVLFLAGGAIGIRFLVKFFSGDGDGHTQSLILATILVLMGFQSILVAFLADLLSANRKLLEDVRRRASESGERRDACAP